MPSKEAYLNCPRCFQREQRGEKMVCGYDGAWLAVYPPDPEKGAICPADNPEWCRRKALELSELDKVNDRGSVWH